MDIRAHITSNHVVTEFELCVDETPCVVSSENHFQLIRALAIRSDHIVLVSPFIYKDFSSLFLNLSMRDVEIELVTTLPFSGNEQLTKPPSLLNFGEIVEAATGLWPSININESLHAKIYVFSNKKKSFAAIVTSANLTHSGLNVNHETGILVTSPEQLSALNDDTGRNISFVNLSKYQIKKLCDVSDFIKNSQSSIPDDPLDYDIGLRNVLKMYCTPSEEAGGTEFKEAANCYIKVSGTRDDPILPEHHTEFGETRREIWFSTSPNKIKIGDCIIEVAVGGKCFLGYYSCASEVHERTKAERLSDADFDRWPFYVFGNNMSLRYGKAWFENPLMYDAITDEFVEKFPNATVTKVGSKSFKGALSFGSSYIEASKEYGKYVRSKIDNWQQTN